MIFEEVDFRELICMVKHVLRAVSMVMFTIKVVAIKRFNCAEQLVAVHAVLRQLQPVGKPFSQRCMTFVK